MGLVKARDIAQFSVIRDSSRGTNKFLYLFSNTYVTSFNSDGFSMNATDNEVNGNGNIHSGKQMAEQHQQIVMAVLMLQYK